MTKMSSPLLSLDPGTSVLADGVRHIIESVISPEEVLLKRVSDGDVYVASIYKLRGLATDQASVNEPAAQDIEKEKLDEASERERHLRPFVIRGTRLTKKEMQGLQIALNLNASRVYDLLRTLKRDHRTKAIVSKRRGPKPGLKKLDHRVEAIVKKEIIARVRTTKPVHIQEIVDAISTSCGNSKLPTPCRESIRTRIEEYGRELTFRRSLGSKRAREATTPTPGKIQTSYALAMVEIDHSPLDVIAVSRKERKPIGRAYITIVIDMHTRAILGFCISLEAPSVLTVALAMTHAILPKDQWLAERNMNDVTWMMYGVPKGTHTDNADEFHSDAFAAGCRAWGMDEPSFRDKGEPQQGAIVERVIGTIQCRIERLPGATGNSVKHRKDHDPDHDSCMTIPEIEEWVTRLICGTYHNKKHSEIEMTPNMAWKDAHMTPEGLRLPAIVTDRRKLLLDFLPLQMRKVTHAGIGLFNDTYWCPVLKSWVGANERIPVRYDPRDMSKIYAEVEPGHYIEVPYSDPTKPALSLWEIRARRRALNEAVKQQHDPAAQLAMDNKMNDIVTKARSAKRALRQAERRYENDVAAGRVAVPAPAPAFYPATTDVDYSMPVEIEAWEEGV